MSVNQSKLERFLKRKSPPPNANENDDGDIPRTGRDGTAPNTNHTSHRSSRISRQEVNFDELPYDPADRRRISDYIGDQLQNDVRRKYLTRGPCKPPSGFKFPQTMIAGFPRRCQHEWFTMYGWLEYSEKVDKCFCFYCYLFRDCNKGQGGNDAFVIDGWDGWNKSDRLRDHVGKKCDSFHNTAMKRCDNLLKPGQSIGEALNKQSNITKENHLIRLKTSIKAVRYLLHQGLAFRGHDETEESTNKGNFRELVQTICFLKLLKCLSNLFPEVIEVLQYVEKEGPNDAKKRQARGLLDYLKDFDFVFHLHLMMLILGHANSLSLSLQRKDKDILEAMMEVKLTKQKFQQIRDDGWDSLLLAVQSFCEEHDIPKLDMDEDYIDRHRPRKKTNRTNYQHYRYDCFNPIIDLQLVEFNDRFNEVNSQLLTQIAAFSPKNSFEAFKFESLMELAKSYPDDFDSTQLRDLGHELNIYIDNVRADERFANSNTISELAKLMVSTNKHQGFPLVYRLLKLVLVLPVATASVERCFSAMKIVKTILRNRIGDGFMNDCIVCFVEQEFLATIPLDDVIIRFHKMKDRNRRGNL